jgi:two-component system cell cycle sensor histidine kinase/response regulator CckA
MTFRDLPIRRKLALLVIFSTVMALALACVGLTIYERARFRANSATELATLADILGANTAASLAFNDQRTAQGMLSALSAESHVVAACLYDERGNIFAEYRRPGLRSDFRMPAWRDKGHQFDALALVLFRPVLLNGDRTGSIAIVSDLTGFHDQMRGYAKIVILVLIASLLATFLLANRFLRIVSNPILGLSAVAARVSLENNYSLRATVSGNDEVGGLIRAVNQMLEKIQLRDLALQNVNDDLETRVQLRTAELEKEVQERKQAEAELHWKTAFLEAQGDATVDGILVVDGNGKIIFHNEPFRSMWRIPQHLEDQSNDAPILEYVVSLIKAPDKFMERVSYLYERPGETSRDEIELKDGAVLDRYSAPVLGKDGKRYGRIWAFRDITERKRNEDALRESEERFRLVVEDAPIGMYIQTDGIFRYLNPAALSMFGAESVEQIVGQRILDRVHPDSRAVVSERVRVLAQERKAIPLLESKRLCLDGSTFDVETTAAPFYFEGRHGAIVFLSDVTERKREEKKKNELEQQLRQAQKMEAVGRLAGGIAHDFNNLLMVIQTYTEMLQDRLPIQDSLRRNTEQVLKAAERGASLTGQMLAFSRKQIISPKVLDLNAVIDETTKMLKRLIGEDIEFQVVFGESLWAIEADPDQIAQVLMNLCVNSRDAMPQGGTLTISTENVRWGEDIIGGHADIPIGDYVKLAVIDTGMGISEDLLERVFEPFFTTKEVGKGTGLGLAMVYGVVKQSGGYVWVDSKLGHGTCFTVYLPKAKKALIPNVRAQFEAHPRGTATLLVVEDEEFIRDGICDFLRTLGYRILAASSGDEALMVAAEQEQIDLLLTDVVMPKMSGRELSQMLGSLRPGLKTIHMSGYTDDAVLQHGVHELSTSFLQKPFSLGTLARKVRDTLGRTELGK